MGTPSLPPSPRPTCTTPRPSTWDCGGWQATASRSSSSPTAGGTRGCPSRDPLTPLGQRVCTYAADTHITGVTSQVTMLYKKRSCCIFLKKKRVSFFLKKKKKKKKKK